MMSRRKQTSHLPNTSNHVPKDDSASAYKNMKNSIKQDGQTEEHSFTAVKGGQLQQQRLETPNREKRNCILMIGKR